MKGPVQNFKEIGSELTDKSTIEKHALQIYQNNCAQGIDKKTLPFLKFTCVGEGVV